MKEIYTAADAAIDILEQRRSDKSIRDKVANYLGGILPANCLTSEQPVGILARYVARATGEDLMFAEFAQELGFNPFWCTYKGDRFTTRNPEKVATIRPPIRWQKGQRTRSWVVEPQNRSGGVGELETIYGYRSSEYQQGIRELVFNNGIQPEIIANEFDVGAWYRIQASRFGYDSGNLAPHYYLATMALVTTYCALFEDFDGGPNAGNGDLAAFRNSVVYPSFDRVEQSLGMRPVIVRLPFVEGMDETNLSFLDGDQVEQFQRNGSKAVMI